MQENEEDEYRGRWAWWQLSSAQQGGLLTRTLDCPPACSAPGCSHSFSARLLLRAPRLPLTPTKHNMLPTPPAAAASTWRAATPSS